MAISYVTTMITNSGTVGITFDKIITRLRALYTIDITKE
jgi:hypothetical protein